MPDYQGEKPKPPLPPVGSMLSSRGPRESGGAPQENAADLQHRLIELEKRLQQEKEKVLLASLRSQEEAAYAAKAETAIKDVQEKLRRDRRDADLEEGRLKLEAKIRELETRLVQERETWVATLQEQVKAREGQDKEVETHFIGRMEEMERRWLEEKAHWQKLFMAKDEEIRNLKIQVERLRILEVDLQKALQEKKFFEEKAQQLAPIQARLQSIEEKEKESYQVKAELMMAKEQAQNLRSSAREREERLLSENERLHQDVQNTAQRLRLESENEIKRFRNELSMANEAVSRLRAVAGALERQRMAFKARVDEVSKQAQAQQQELSQAKAELLAVQQHWQENELRIRREAEAAAGSRSKDDLRMELEDEWRQKEAKIRKELEEANVTFNQRLDERSQIAHSQMEILQASLQAKNDEVRGLQEKLAQVESEKSRWESERLQIQSQKEPVSDALTTEQLEKQEGVFQENRRVQKELEDTRKALEQAEKNSAAAKIEIATLEEKLTEELRQKTELERARREKQEDAFTEKQKAQKDLEDARKVLEQAKKISASSKIELVTLEDKLADEVRQKAELEKKMAQLENLAELAHQDTQTASRKLESRIQVLEEEIEQYRKPKSGLLGKFLGQGKPQPPKPPNFQDLSSRGEKPPSPPH